jgi:hypothetical protein
LRVFCFSYELKQQEHLFDQALLRITITVAVVLPHQGRRRLPPNRIISLKEVVTMISIDTVIAIVTLTVTSVGLGLQIASYMNTKNDRPSSKR